MATDPTAADEMRSVCSLSAKELPRRRQQILELLQRTRRLRELDDGHVLEFPGDDRTVDLLPQLVRLIDMERRCCPTLTFELSFESESGPIRLAVRGPDAATAFIEDLLGQGYGDTTTNAEGDATMAAEGEDE